ncbi:MAG: branched-chain amino acid ABC transporter permease [Archaeoglobaceae archaeon]|nr:branched-chain amino acid ABC transporter permease [Archaeoglobaceae archaeon]MDW7989112.1 branched-chain amino acid ABC transporter permease [Archaeoglobaceae archaeon]
MKNQILILLILFFVLILLPTFTPSAYLYLIGLSLIFAVIVVSWDLMVGYTGQVNLGHTAFVGIGAYVSAILQLPLRIGFFWEIHPMIAILFSGLFSALVGLGIGIVTLRLKGYYFSLVTAILPLVFMQKVFIWREVFGGEEGFSIPAEKIVFATTIEKYYFATFFMFISMLIMLYIVRSKIGLRFKAIRDSEELSESLGINTTLYKILAFFMSSFFAGIAGAVFVNYRLTVSPDLYDIPLMLLVILSAVIGGLGSLIGPLLMGIVVYLAKNWWLTALRWGMINEELVLYVILIAVAIIMPRGVYNEILERSRR